MRAVRITLAILLWSVVALCLTVTVLPHFLDRIYYRGPVSDHFDGQRFFNPDKDDDRLAAGTVGRLLWRQLASDPDRPVWPDRVPVTSTRPPARVDGQAMRATWVGHATLLVQTQGINILTDPVWSRTVGPFGFGPARVAAPGIRFEDLPKIDIVLVSHNHYDHLDLTTLKRLWQRDRPLIVTGLGNDAVIAGAGVPAQALDWGRSAGFPQCPRNRQCEAPLVQVTVTRSHHWDSRWFADRNRALWSSFVVRLPGGNFFFAGDTGLGDGKWPAEAAALGPIRLAAIPIGAFRFAPGQMAAGSHIGPWGALGVWNGLGRPFALPIHWGTFRLGREAYDTPPRMLAAMMRCAGGDPARFAPAAIGQGVDVPPLSPTPPVHLAAIRDCARDGAFDGMR